MGSALRKSRVTSLLLCYLFLTFGIWPQQSQPTTQSQPPTTAPTQAISTPAEAKTTPQKQGSAITEFLRQTPQKSANEQLQLNTELVNVAITVTDPYGRYVVGLEQSSFELYEDKLKQNIAFFSHDDSPVSIGVVFDISGSMKSRISRANEALQKFVDASHREDDFFVVTFNQTAKLLSDFTTDGRALANSLSLVEAKGNTALYDATYMSVEKVRQGRHNRRAIIIISDGQDNNSRYTYKELRRIIKEADVQIYGLGITEFNGGGTLDFQGQAILEEIARTTGGRAFFPGSDLELEDAITRIALELRNQYNLSYYPQTGAQDGKWHKLKVVINPPKGMPRLTVRAREGYYGQKLLSVESK